MQASSTNVRIYRTWAWARDYFPAGSPSRAFIAHFKGNGHQRRVARRSYIRFAKATCAARGIPLYINGILQ